MSVNCKSNGITVAVDYACRYSLPIDNPREVIEEMNSQLEHYDQMVETVDRLENVFNLLDDWNDVIDESFDDLLEAIVPEEDKQEKLVLLIDRIMQKIKSEVE